jgi:hypothetical protein
MVVTIQEKKMLIINDACEFCGRKFMHVFCTPCLCEDCKDDAEECAKAEFHNAPLTDRRPDAGSVQGVVESSDMSDLSDKSDGLAT